MATTIYWLQCGACGGDSMAFLGAARPDLAELIESLDLEVLWHPSLSNGRPAAHRALIEAIQAREQPLDVLCVEGAVIRGPGGTGMYDAVGGTPKKDLLVRLAKRARFVVAVGTCAAFGGIPAEAATEATGLQFHKAKPGGFLGEWFNSSSGLPVINLPGCPCRSEVIVSTLTALARKDRFALTPLQSPVDWFSTLVHQGCTRNEYHEFRVEDAEFGRPGCLYFHLGCLGPLTYAPCNKNIQGHTSGPRAGVPCTGCARPDFPQRHPFFNTRNIEGVPLDLPDGVDRAHFLAYKELAAAAAPARLKNRANKV
jgi:hydrogenase small subunit